MTAFAMTHPYLVAGIVILIILVVGDIFEAFAKASKKGSGGKGR